MGSKTIGGLQQTVTDVNGDSLPFNLTEVDRETLAMTDEEFVPHSWEELKDIIRMCYPGSASWTNASSSSFCHSNLYLTTFPFGRSE